MHCSERYTLKCSAAVTNECPFISITVKLMTKLKTKFKVTHIQQGFFPNMTRTWCKFDKSVHSLDLLCGEVVQDRY